MFDAFLTDYVVWQNALPFPLGPPPPAENICICTYLPLVILMTSLGSPNCNTFTFFPPALTSFTSFQLIVPRHDLVRQIIA